MTATAESNAKRAANLAPYVTESTFNEQRRQLARECVWEIDALLDTMRSLIGSLGTQETDQAELMRTGLQLRGIATRVSDLDLAVMSILDDDRSTVELERVVYGRQ